MKRGWKSDDNLCSVRVQSGARSFVWRLVPFSCPPFFLSFFLRRRCVAAFMDRDSSSRFVHRAIFFFSRLTARFFSLEHVRTISGPSRDRLRTGSELAQNRLSIGSGISLSGVRCTAAAGHIPARRKRPRQRGCIRVNPRLVDGSLAFVLLESFAAPASDL